MPDTTTIAITEQARELLRRWVDAEQRGDASALDALLAADFRAVGPRGFVLDKQQWLDRYRSGDLVNQSFNLDDVDVRSYGAVAVAVASQTQQATYQGHPADGRFRVTLVAAPVDGRLTLAALHLSPIVERP
jgi:hypothetical protein